MWPGWINLVLCLDTCIRHLQVRLSNIRQWPEDVLLDHGHHVVEVGNDEAHNGLLVLQVLLNLIDRVESLGLTLHVFGFVLIIIIFLAYQQLLLKALLRLLLWTLGTSTGYLIGCTRSGILVGTGTRGLAGLLVGGLVHLTHI